MATSRMRFVVPGNGTYYIDLAKALSLQERKLHRQKKIYTVYGGYMKDQDGSIMHMNTAPNTWPIKRSVNRGFALWRKMISRTLRDMEGAGTGSYSDFKVFLTSNMGIDVLDPVDASDNNLFDSAPEWDYSTLTTEDPADGAPADQFDLHIVGPHIGSDPDWARIGLLQSWVNSRAIPDSAHPDLPAAFATDPLNNLFDAGDVQDDRLTILASEGDAAPYDEDTMFGNAVASHSASNNLQRVSSSQTSSSNPITPVMGFQAICGLIQVVVSGTDTAGEIVLDVETNGVKF
jgi:hypothetical protein